MQRDYKAPAYWRAEDLARIASELRGSASTALQANFKVTDFVQHDLERLLRRGHIIIEIEDLTGSPDFPACVKFNPLKLICDSEIWQHAKLGDPYSRFIIAHEIGHLVLHAGHEQHFSDPANGYKTWMSEGESTEWQANTFAKYFLVPDYILYKFEDADHLAEACDVEIRVALDRMSEKGCAMRQISGQACEKCSNFAIFRVARDWKCGECGFTTAVAL